MRALISVSDKTGLLEFARGLLGAGWELVATGRSAEALRAAGIQVRGIEDLTRQPEILRGRVKTLSYQIFAGILFRRGDASDEREIAGLGDLAIDLVVVNFYPFEENPSIETIDIGGPSLVRAAAKNSEHVTVVTDPADYPRVLANLCGVGGKADLQAMRQDLARKAWAYVAGYDQAIAAHYGSPLRYGENAHQEARWVGPPIWRSLTPQALSYSNILDVSAAVDLLHSIQSSALLRNRPEVALVFKHAGPCGVALATTQEQALRLAWEGDPVSAFGSVVVLSQPLGPEAASFLKDRFFEAVVAPELEASSPSLLNLVAARKKLKAVALPPRSEILRRQVTSVLGGMLVQEVDRVEDREVLEAAVHGGSVSDADRERLMFAVHCVAALKSNALAVVREIDGALQLIGTGQGQPNRIEALEGLALPRARRVADTLEGVAVASDGFFPFADSIEALARAGVNLVAQPGGSVQDPQVIAAAERLNVRMLLTGKRHFKH